MTRIYVSDPKEKWRLDSGAARCAEAPGTFEIPALSRRESVRPGAFVKLIFEISWRDRNTGALNRQTERMWVVVTRTAGKAIVGHLDNAPECETASQSPPLACGAELQFGPEHIIAIGDVPLSDKELESFVAQPSPMPLRVHDA